MKRKRHARWVVNEDTLVEILARLPAKSISRFRCVSKQWLSLTSDPQFIQNHASLASISGFFLCSSSRNALYFSSSNARQPFSRPDPFSSINFPDLPTRFDGSCNGLILCHRYRSDGRRMLLCVCNPMITGGNAIFSGPDNLALRYCFSLAFDPSTSPHFKVVGFGADPQSKGLSMYIYSSGTQLWKLLVENLCDEFCDMTYFSDMTYYSRSIFWNGSLLWLGAKESLISFNVEREKLGRIRYPRPSCRAYLIESRGRLHFIADAVLPTKAASGFEFMTEFVIFEMQPDCASWCELHRVDLSSILDVYPEVIHPVSDELIDIFSPTGLSMFIIWFVRGRRGGDQLLLSIPGKIISYHIEKQIFTAVCNTVHGPSGRIGGYDSYPWHFSYPHVHTLFSL